MTQSIDKFSGPGLQLGKKKKNNDKQQKVLKIEKTAKHPSELELVNFRDGKGFYLLSKKVTYVVMMWKWLK